jgi:hypothetical protein
MIGMKKNVPQQAQPAAPPVGSATNCAEAASGQNRARAANSLKDLMQDCIAYRLSRWIDLALMVGREMRKVNQKP